MQRIFTSTTLRHGLRFSSVPTQQRLFSHTPLLRAPLDPNSMSAKEVASELAKAETQKTGTGPIAGGAAGMFNPDSSRQDMELKLT